MWERKMSTDSKVVSFTARAAAANTEGAFLDVIAKDMRERPEGVVPVSRDLLSQMDALCEKAKEAQRNEAMEC